jgi:hypothetical protein
LNRFIVRTFVLVWVLCWVDAAEAHGGPNINLPDLDVGVGPSVAYVGGSRQGVSVNLDIALTHAFDWTALGINPICSASLNLKYIGGDGTQLFGPQLELSTWILANIGGGVGYWVGSDSGVVTHVFVGVPVEVSEGSWWLMKTLYLEPYYRLNFFRPRRDWLLLHEAGLMVKVTTFDL